MSTPLLVADSGPLIALALPATLLIDDRRARRAAQVLGVTAMGTMGLLVRARQDALIPPLRPQLDFLCATGYFLSARLIVQVLSEVGEWLTWHPSSAVACTTRGQLPFRP
jgi:uncharacterized protein